MTLRGRQPDNRTWTATRLWARARWLPAAVVLLWLANSPGRALGAMTCPGATVSAGSLFEVELSAAVGSRAMGAYTIVLSFDPNDVLIDAVRGGSTAEFAGLPLHNAGDFSSGRLRLSGFNASSLTRPVGAVHFASVRLRVLESPRSTSPLSLEFVALSDTDGAPIEAPPAACTVTLGSVPITPTASPTATATPSPTPPPVDDCRGDCGGDRRVDVTEIVQLVNIALGNLPLDSCPPLVGRQTGVVVSDIILAITHALQGCPTSTR